MARTRRRRARDVLDTDPQPLDVQRIVEAALVLLDEVGFEGLSMRNLAERLGIQAATLYWYLRDKQELLSLLGETISAEMEPPDPHAPWRARLAAMMWEYRRVLLAHRDAARVLAATLPAGSHRLRLVDLTLGAVLEAGFEGWDATRAGRLLVDYATGFVQEEYIAAARVSPPAADPTDEQSDTPGLPSFANASAEAYPSIAALGPYLADRESDARFSFGLEVILNGLQQRRRMSAGAVRSRALPVAQEKPAHGRKTRRTPRGPGPA